MYSPTLLQRAVFWLLGLSILVNSVSAFYSKRDAVVNVDSANWQKEVMETEHAVLAEFYAPWCGHCKNLTPEYKKAAEKLKGLVKVVAIDCDAEKNKPTCGAYQIRGFPTLKLFGTGKKGMPEDYNGPRTAKGLVDAAVAKIRGYVTPIGHGTSKKAATYEDFIAKDAGKLAKVILVSQKSSTPPLFKALSTEYHHRLNFGEVKSQQKDLVEKLKVENFPAVVVIPKEEGAEPIVYDGAMKFAALSEFLDKYAVEAKKGKRSSSKADEEEPKKEAPKKKKNDVPFDPKIPELQSQSDLTHHCLTNNTICAISFLTLEPDYPDSVTAHTLDISLLQSIKQKFHSSHPETPLTFLWVNPITLGAKLIQDFGVSDMYPTMLVIANNGKDKAKGLYWRFMGSWEEKSVEEFVRDSIAGGTGRNRVRKYEFEPVLDKGVRQRVVERAEEVREEVKVKVEEVKEKAEEVKEKVVEKAEEVKEKAEEVKEAAEEKAEEIKEAVKEKVEEVTEAIKEKVEEAKEAVKDEL
ncbi:protein disulfide isomerase (PDI) protein [Rhizophlyctis rosea]|nr:protein disulfide isomerase (PDI) protein [Rhizophlyctis rosea]